jgi:prevent-host-death family protein
MVMLYDRSMDMVTSELTLSVSEFKAKCLDIMKRLGEHRLRKVTITRRGKPVAVVTPPQVDEPTVRSLLGSMKDRTWIDPSVDLTKPISDEEWNAEKGILYLE